MKASSWRAGAALALLSLAAAAQGADGAVFVEIDGVPASAWQQEPFVVTVRIGYDAAWFASAAVPLFQQQLELPFHVVVPWLQAAEDRAVELLPPPAGEPVRRGAIGDRVAPLRTAGSREQAGRRFELLELRCRWLALAPGELAVAPVTVRYAFATRFEEDFLRGRQPVDRQELTAAGSPGRCFVKALPAPAPAGFCGAVGAFTVAAATEASTVAVGTSFAVTLDVRGDGNLERFAVPAAPPLAGFHVQGLVERRLPGARRFVLDVVALRPGSTSLPSLPFVAFAPASGSYVTLATAPLPLQVEPAAGPLSPQLQDLVAADARAVARANAAPWWWYGLGFVGLVAVVVIVQRGQRGRAHAAERARLRAALAAAGADAAARLAAFEAAVALGTSSPFAAATTWQQLAARGVPAAELERAKAMHAALDAARFGGTTPDGTAVLAALDALAPGR